MHTEYKYFHNKAVDGNFNQIKENHVQFSFPYSKNATIRIQFRNILGLSEFSDKFQIHDVSQQEIPNIPGGTIAAIIFCVVFFTLFIIIYLRK